MTKEQQGYPTHEQELLALMIAQEESRHYGPVLTVLTDHNRLRYLWTQSSLNNRQWRWLAHLSESCYDLKYRAGKNMHWSLMDLAENPTLKENNPLSESNTWSRKTLTW